MTDFHRPFYLSNPTVLLAMAVGLFLAPSLYLLVAVMLRQQATQTTLHVSSVVSTVIWVLGAAQLLLAITIPRSMHSLPASTRFVLILAVTTSAPIFGLVLAVLGGGLTPLALLGLASMIATALWSWRYRECFRSQSLEKTVSAYTATLIVAAIAGLFAAGLRFLSLEHFNSAPTALFAMFMNVVVAVGALLTARLRRLSSPYAKPATRVVSVAHLYALPFGFVVFLYWLVWVRRREQAAVGRT